MIFDSERAEKPIRFIERLKTSNGDAFRLLDWQKDFIRRIFGTLSDDQSTRQYREAALWISRQNGKSTLCSGILLYLLFTGSEPNAQYYSIANDREQASILFRAMSATIQQNKLLLSRCKIVPTTKTIVYQPTKSYYRALASDGVRNLGLSASAFISDETGFFKNEELFSSLQTGQVSKPNALAISISTVGQNKESFGFRLWERSRKAIENPDRDPRFLPVVFAAPQDTTDEQCLSDENVWHKANPSLGHTISLDSFKAIVGRAKAEPSFLGNFKRYHLNLWADSDDKWIPLSIWNRNNKAVNPDELRGKTWTCYAGIDLSRSDDTSAISLVFPLGDGEYSILCHIAAPSATASKREAAGVPYRQWARDGWLNLHEGSTIDYEKLLMEIESLSKLYNIAGVAIDPFNATFFSQKLTAKGFAITPFRQGFLSFADPCREFEHSILSGKLNHGGNPVLAWQVSNLVAESDSAGNIKPNREKSSDKIDAAVACIMGLSLAMKNPSVNQQEKPGEISSYIPVFI